MTADFRTRVRDLSRAAGFDEHADAIAALAIECAHLVPGAPAAQARLGGSRFGGSPDLAPGVHWPRNDRGALYSFVLQIDLAEVPPLTDSPLPAEGLLSLFTGENDETFDIYHRVLYMPPGKRVRIETAPSARFADPRLGATMPVSMRIERGVALPAYQSDELEQLALDPAQQGRYLQLYEQVTGRVEVSTLLGHPYSPNGAIQLAGKALLFLVPSHRAPKLNWWDRGILHVLAARADLEARVFDRTVAGIYTS